MQPCQQQDTLENHGRSCIKAGQGVPQCTSAPYTTPGAGACGSAGQRIDPHMSAKTTRDSSSSIMLGDWLPDPSPWESGSHVRSYEYVLLKICTTLA
jgi:hypothetical protein